MGTNPFLGQITLFGGNFAPQGYAFCDGQLLSIQQNTALFSILGTTYGGNGTTNFGLPDLQGASPLHPGQGPGLTPRVLGESGGAPSVTLTEQQLPFHTHTAIGIAAAGTQQAPTGGYWAEIRGLLYGTTPDSLMSPVAVGAVGGNLPHNNLPPYQAINFIIALVGIYPTRS